MKMKNLFRKKNVPGVPMLAIEKSRFPVNTRGKEKRVLSAHAFYTRPVPYISAVPIYSNLTYKAVSSRAVSCQGKERFFYREEIRDIHTFSFLSISLLISAGGI